MSQSREKEERRLKRVFNDQHCDQISRFEEVRETYNVRGPCADGVGHRPTCRFVAVEVKTTELRKAIDQLDNTIRTLTAQDIDVEEGIIYIENWAPYSDRYKTDDNNFLLNNLGIRKPKAQAGNRNVRIIKGGT